MKGRILLIAPTFYGYYKDIMDGFNKLDFEVDYYCDRCNRNFFELCFNKIYKKYFKKKMNAHTDDIIAKFGKNTYDYVIVILGDLFSDENLLKLKNTFNKSCFVNYLWDSIKTFKNSLNNSKYFDRVYSFDNFDCEKYGFKFLPLFYKKKEDFSHFEKKYDYVSVMNLDPKKVESYTTFKNLKKPELVSFTNLRIPSFLFYIYFSIRFRKLYKSYKLNELSFKNIPYDVYLEKLKQTKVVVDCPLKTQVGLTMRTFETLSHNLKLITTNINIKNYDFYNSENIFVIDDESELTIDFFNKPFNKEYELSEKYSITTFVKTLIDFQED